MSQIQIRYELNHLNDSTLEPLNNQHLLNSPYRFQPVLDFRDDGTVWVWLRTNLCVELDRELVDEIQNGFKEQEK
jgi:hypothetical protein